MDRIWMPFGIIGRTGPGMRQVVGFGNRSTGRGTVGGEFGVCNQWGLYGAMRPSCQITLGRLDSHPSDSIMMIQKCPLLSGRCDVVDRG